MLISKYLFAEVNYTDEKNKTKQKIPFNTFDRDGGGSYSFYLMVKHTKIYFKLL